MTKKKDVLKINREFYRLDQKEFGANIELQVKKCTRCKDIKPLSSFQHGRGYVDGYYKHCRKCHYDIYVRDSHYKRTYGISQDDYNKLVANVNYKCPICGAHHVGDKKHGRLVVDHCHKTGKIRGIICSQCNFALGSVKDNVETLARLIAYLNESNDDGR